jgi:hypothetical protein
MLADITCVVYSIPTTVMKRLAESASTLYIADGMFLLIEMAALLVLS